MPGRRTKKDRLSPVMGLMLNSMVDMLTILLVFLLKSFSTQPELNVNIPGLTLPVSHSSKDPEITTTIVVAKDKIIVAHNLVAKVGKNWDVEGSPDDRFLIPGLYQALIEEAKKQKYLARVSGQKFEGKISLIADKNMPFALLKRVLYTAGQAEFSLFKFATYKEEEEEGKT